MPPPLPLLSAAFLAMALVASSCDKTPLSTTPEELADAIRAATPTELPPITTAGLNTMGAYAHTDTGRVLFVASGVDRPETALAASLDCEPFNNYLFLSNDYLSVGGVYCERPEIGDRRRINMTLGYIRPDSIQLSLIYSNGSKQAQSYWTRAFPRSRIAYTILRDDRDSRILSGTFSGTAVNRDPPYDTLRISDGRFDVTYGVTP